LINLYSEVAFGRKTLVCYDIEIVEAGESSFINFKYATNLNRFSKIMYCWKT